MRDLEPLVQVGLDEGAFIQISPQLLTTSRALENMRQRLAAHFKQSPTAKVGEMRQEWGITRKHAVPLFEYFDLCQITSRAGDVRSAGPRLHIPIDGSGA
jgi:hypothetical protein